MSPSQDRCDFPGPSPWDRIGTPWKKTRCLHGTASSPDKPGNTVRFGALPPYWQSVANSTASALLRGPELALHRQQAATWLPADPGKANGRLRPLGLTLLRNGSCCLAALEDPAVVSSRRDRGTGEFEGDGDGRAPSSVYPGNSLGMVSLWYVAVMMSGSNFFSSNTCRCRSGHIARTKTSALCSGISSRNHVAASL
jgi:hypothetical protein